MAKQLTKDGKYGWVLNYGAPEGIGGVASYWMAFLQQAGGTMYDAAGQPAFDTPEGVEALQVMIDLMPYTDPGSISYVGINDATNVFSAGNAAMMLNWPFMWVPANDPASSTIAGKVGAALNPAGPAGTASIDGTDAYTITKLSPDPELAAKLIEFYLDPAVQKSQSMDTGWLPIRLSVLNDPEVQAKSANAATVLEQAQHPYDSFVTPDYNEVTQALGTEIQKALAGAQDAATTLKTASDLVDGDRQAPCLSRTGRRRPGDDVGPPRPAIWRAGAARACGSWRRRSSCCWGCWRTPSQAPHCCRSSA